MTGKRRSAERTQQKAVRGGSGGGRGRRELGLIGDRRARNDAFAKRKKTLQVKARELSVLCGVDVALVVAAPDGDGADVWESSEGAVLARYRALDPEVRARHTHRAYLEGELGKEEAKLVRVRQAGPTGLDAWDKALDGIATAEEARQMLETIDAAILAAEDRMRALGLPVDDDGLGDGVVLEGIAPLDVAGVDGYPLYAPGGGGGDTNDYQAIWGNAGLQGYGFQQCNTGSGGAGMEGYHLQIAPDMYGGGAGMEGYHLQIAPDMYGGGGSSNSSSLETDANMYQPCDSGTMQHGYDFQCARTGYSGVPAGHQIQLGWGAAQPNLAMWSTEEPCHAMVPVHYAAESCFDYMDTPVAHGAQGGCGGGSFATGGSGNFVNAAPEHSLAMGIADCNFINEILSTPPVALPHTFGDTGDNFTNTTPAQPLAMSYGGDLAIAGRYAPQWQAAQHQQPSRTAGRPGQQSGFRKLEEEEEDMQLHLWGN